MQPLAAFLLGLVATLATAQAITLTPTTIRGPTRPAECPVTLTTTLTETTKVEVTKTEISVKTVTTVVTSVRTSVSTAATTVRQTSVSTATTTVRQTSVSTATTTVRQTVTSVGTVTTTRPCQSDGVNCPTLTSTVSPCSTCLVPDCTEIVQVTRPCGCVGDLPTTTINLDCYIDNVCQQIGCKTAYDVQTAICN